MQDLPDDEAAIARAGEYALMNSVDGSTYGVTVGSYDRPNDSITVTASSRVSYTFLRVLGLTGADVSADSTAVAAPLTGFALDAVDVFPYAIWGGNPQTTSCPHNICVNDQVVFRSNNYQDGVLPDYKTNSNYVANKANFKGFFAHSDGEIVFIEPDHWQTFSKGGNSMDHQPTAELAWHRQEGIPVVFPVINAIDEGGKSSSVLQFKIVAWVCAELDPGPDYQSATDEAASVDWTAKVLGFCPPDLVEAGRGNRNKMPPDGFPNAWISQLVD